MVLQNPVLVGSLTSRLPDLEGLGFKGSHRETPVQPRAAGTVV